jgi:phosphoesterase RecJ-like protein
MLNWQAVMAMVVEAERVLLTTHVRPDGDALGSELAMAELLLEKGKEVEIFNPSPTPPRYQFLDPTGAQIGAQREGKGLPRMQPDLLMILDTGTWAQLAGLADYVRQLPADKIVIDHHHSQDDLGALQLVDVHAEACGMMVHDAFLRFGAEVTERAAQALFVAIATDTGWVHHSNASAAVFKTLGELVAKGARPTELYQHIYECNSLARLHLMGVMLERLSLRLDGRLASSYILQSDLQRTGAHPMDTEDFINLSLSIRGVEAAVLFIEQASGGTKVSFRARGSLDCSRLAEQFGGGGHRAAAGATLDQTIDGAQRRVLLATELAMTG